MSQDICDSCGTVNEGSAWCVKCGRGFKDFIVVEISKNWTRGEINARPLLCQQFEEAIEVNNNRGYRLLQFQLHQLMTCADPETMTETIIAVFERIQ